ncbi:hypothetical protein CR513_32932, partial [Mucuna pruriens]
MKEIKSVNVNALKHLIKILSSKSQFTPNPNCDILLNNMCEAFNSVIVDARGKSIVTMVYLMERWATNKQKIASFEASILPKIKKKLEKESEVNNYWIISLSWEKLFEVKHLNFFGDKFTINLDSQECSCRKWMLTSIPCCHVTFYMKFMNLDPNEYILAYFQMKTCEVFYQYLFYPINGEHLRQKKWCNDVLLPLIKKMQGRPKKR